MSLKSIIEQNKRTGKSGIYSICSAHPIVIEAAIEQAKRDHSFALIEATANQVNQFGGYTNMQPEDYKAFVENIANQVGLPLDKLILGGDHLGPVCWTNESSEQAMSKSVELIKHYVRAGFKKLHLDTSMPCLDDPSTLTDQTIAKRAALLCEAAEKEAIKTFGKSDIAYVIGTEVPPPGGATEELKDLEVTPAANVDTTIKIHQDAFNQLHLEDAWQRVIAVVVQPGVEFDNMQVVDYQTEPAQQLANYIRTIPNLVFEAHSTDYQKQSAYKALVNDHFAILKVGPQLTYALREGLYALSYIEQELIPVEQQSRLREICEQEMTYQPESWKKFYPVPAQSERLYRHYSYSDRIRYYWNNPRINEATNKLLTNLAQMDIPLPLISQFFADCYPKVREQEFEITPTRLVKEKILAVTNSYASACWKQ